MQSTLLISMDDILHYATINGSIDEFKINPIILSSQILYLEPILGSDLYEKIINLIETDEMSGATNYKLLLDHYIIPSLVFHVMELFIPLNSFQIDAAGVMQFSASNAESSTASEIDRQASRYRIIGAKFDSKLVKYLSKNSNLFIEYTNNQGLVDKEETTNRAAGIYLGLNNMKTGIRI